MTYLSEIFGRHSWDVFTLFSKNKIFCMSVSVWVGLLPYWNWTNVGISSVLDEIYSWKIFETFLGCLDTILKYCKTSEECLPKISERYSSRTANIPTFLQFLWGGKPTNRLTDIKETCNYLKKCKNIPEMSPKKFKTAQPRTYPNSCWALPSVRLFRGAL